MSTQAYLIDTNVIIGLEDNHAVQPAFAELLRVAAKHKVDVFVHEAAREDLLRDRDAARQKISLSKLAKFQTLNKVRGLGRAELEREFGRLPKDNDVVDATLLDAVNRGVADFLITQDRGLHDRARRHSSELSRRVLFVADAVQLLKTTYEPVETPIRYVEEASANEISTSDGIFASLREDYPAFDTWWREKCVKERRSCWVVYDTSVAGLVVRKDESAQNTDATTKLPKILKVCTFKVKPESRGVKLGELLLKKIFWFAQHNNYDLVYLTTYPSQVALIDLLEYYGFLNTTKNANEELVYEKTFSRDRLDRKSGTPDFDVDRLNYPRFITTPGVRAFGVPIREDYHDTLYPDLKNPLQPDLFASPSRPGNTIRKVYLCRAMSNLGAAGSLLFFYKGKSKNPPSQALTAVGVFEECSIARSTRDLLQLTGGRSVYSEEELKNWNASPTKPVKVINYLLAGYIDPPIPISEMRRIGMMGDNPPQSIFEMKSVHVEAILRKADLGFAT
jgi:predicted nucleic acid-binding protein/ribosomal protein S18 acetylase RimI-like enzyme